MASTRVLVIGATQGTGSLIAQQLLQRNIAVRVLARNISKAQGQFGLSADIVQGDITKAATLETAFRDVTDVICTAGVTQRPASEQLIRATEFDGMQHVLAAAKQHGLSGRFLYMTSIGIGRTSFAAWVLNRVKGNTLYWRERVEEHIRASGFRYTIVRCGVLTNTPVGQHAVRLTQGNQPLTFTRKISRGDVTTICLAALREPAAENTTFEIVWDKRQAVDQWKQQLQQLKPDVPHNT